MIVVGGFNSSNTTHLLEICLPVTHAYHIEDVHGLVSPDWIRHKPLDESTPILSDGWLPRGPAVLGVTAGASTPDTAVGATLAKLMRYRNISEEEIAALSETGSRLAEEKRLGRGGRDTLPVSS
jgi:4-hydroxy-3-methylbut-2-enyl diphosphate reductase